MVWGAEEVLLGDRLEAFGLIEAEEMRAVDGDEAREAMVAAVATLADGVDDEQTPYTALAEAGKDGKAVEIVLARLRLGLLMEGGIVVGQRAGEAEGLAEHLIGARAKGGEKGAVVGDETSGGDAIDVGHAGVAVGIENGLVGNGLDERRGRRGGGDVVGHLAFVEGGDDGVGDEWGIGGCGVAEGDGHSGWGDVNISCIRG